MKSKPTIHIVWVNDDEYHAKHSVDGVTRCMGIGSTPAEARRYLPITRGAADLIQREMTGVDFEAKNGGWVATVNNDVAIICAGYGMTRGAALKAALGV